LESLHGTWRKNDPASKHPDTEALIKNQVERMEDRAESIITSAKSYIKDLKLALYSRYLHAC